MGIEIEKKYRLTPDQRSALSQRLREVGARWQCTEFEENTIYTGGNLDPRRQVLRLRRTADAAIFTFKERSASTSPIRHQREDETRVENAAALEAILDALGYRPVLIYEKRRVTWRVHRAEVVLDELPFGFFVEIEGEEHDIEEAEGLLELTDVAAEMATYPELTEQYGERRGDVIEARFQMLLPAL